LIAVCNSSIARANSSCCQSVTPNVCFCFVVFFLFSFVFRLFFGLIFIYVDWLFCLFLLEIDFI